MPAESQVSSASGAVEFVSSECNANGVIINVGDGYDGGGGGVDHSGSGKQGFKVSRDDADDKSNVNVSINDNSPIPVPVPMPVDGYAGSGNNSKEGVTEDLPNRKHDATEVDHGTLGKADDYGDDSVDTLNCDSVNKADDSSPGDAVEVILEKGTVSGERDSKSSAASESDDQETEVAPLTLESVTKGVENAEPGQEDLQDPDVLVNGGNSLVLDSAAASLDDSTESTHVNHEHLEDGILVSSISNKSSEGCC